jgi:UDP-glucose:(heptosyl)LPS alpha-1,3-glucosyltransferase
VRLALVRQRYNPFGGAERFVERAIGALERQGVDVTLITRSWAGASGRDVLKVDPFYIGSFWRDAGFARAARAAWEREGFELVQSHERIPGCTIYRAGDGVHRQWLAYRLEAGGARERLRVRADPYHRYVCAAERRMFEHARLRAVVCNSRMVRDDILRHFAVRAEKLHVIYNGIDLERYQPRGRPGRADPAFLFVGSGYARKGLDALLAALASVPRARLAVAGQDRDAEGYAALAARLGVAGRVRFLGAVADVRPLYAEADCFILPSLYDPFPNAALEAWAMGVPVIASRRCGSAELVREGENGWTCAPNDAKGLAERMQRAADAAGDGRMRAAARATAETCGLEAMAAKLAALYRAVLGETE